MSQQPRVFMSKITKQTNILVFALFLLSFIFVSQAPVQAHEASRIDCSKVVNSNSRTCTHGGDFFPASTLRVYQGENATMTQKIQANPSLSSQTKGKMIANINTESAPSEAYCSGTTANYGARVQIIYLRKPSQPALTGARKKYLQDIAATVNYNFQESARKTSGDIKVRWVRNSDCSISIKEIITSQSADLTRFPGVQSALVAAGKTSNDRKYLTFLPNNFHTWDNSGNGVCGAATLHRGEIFDDGPAQNNINNTRVGYAAIWYGNARSCWNDIVATHELVHNLGGVQYSAPRSTGAGHCTDGRDVMCYSDGGPYAGNYTMSTCPAQVYDHLLDCGDNDYFSANPAPNTYLTQRWNVANSRFLVKR